MRSEPSAWNAALTLSIATLLSFIARAFIDYGFVFRELYPATGSIGILTLVYVAFLAGWIGALLSASHMVRRAMYALLAYGAIVALHAGVTFYSFCPFPCRTAWPVGQVVITANLLLGVLGVAAALLGLRRRVA